MSDTLITTREIAKALGVSRRTIQKYINRGCPCVRAGLGKPNRFNLPVVLEWRRVYTDKAKAAPRVHSKPGWVRWKEERVEDEGSADDPARIKTANEAGFALGVTPSTVLRWAKDYGCPHVAIRSAIGKNAHRLFSIDEVREWAQRRNSPARLPGWRPSPWTKWACSRSVYWRRDHRQFEDITTVGTGGCLRKREIPNWDRWSHIEVQAFSRRRLMATRDYYSKSWNKWAHTARASWLYRGKRLNGGGK